MKKICMMVACLGFMTGGVWIVAADQPGTPALPAGHPDVSKKATANGPAATMPAGHPDISQMPAAPGKGALPAGHPDVSQKSGAAAGGQGDLPAGHPDVSKKSAAPAGGAGSLPSGHPDIETLRAAATQPAGTGTLLIRALQGTKGGPAIGADPVIVELYVEGGHVLKTIEAKLGPKGEVEVAIPLDVICQPVVRILHAGVGYEGEGRVMDRNRRSQQIEMTLAEATDKQPAWEVKVRHVLMHVEPQGMHVTEMLSIMNPSDLTWIGTESDGKRTTLSMPLSAGATDLTVTGLHAGAMAIRNNNLVTAMPLLPGSNEFQVQYVVPLTDGKADLTIIAPAPVGQMFVFIPDDGSTVTTSALDSLGVRKTGDGDKRGYKAANMKTGQEAKLSFSGLKAPAATQPLKKSAAGSSYLPHIAAGVGGGLVLLGGVTVMLVRSGRKGASQG